MVPSIMKMTVDTVITAPNHTGVMTLHSYYGYFQKRRSQVSFVANDFTRI